MPLVSVLEHVRRIEQHQLYRWHERGVAAACTRSPPAQLLYQRRELCHGTVQHVILLAMACMSEYMRESTRVRVVRKRDEGEHTSEGGAEARQAYRSMHE